MASPILTAAHIGSTSYTPWYKSPFDTSPAYASLGEIEPRNGIRERRVINGEPIAVNSLGEGTPVDTIYQGMEMYLEFVLQEAQVAAVHKLLHQQAKSVIPAVSAGSFAPLLPRWKLGVPGIPMSTVAGALALVPVSEATPGYGQPDGSNILLYECVILQNGQQIEKQLRAGLLTIPVVLQCLPYSDGGSPATMIFGRQVATLPS